MYCNVNLSFGLETDLFVGAGVVSGKPGLDPQSAEHLQRLIEEIKEELLKQKSVQFVIIVVVVVVVLIINRWSENFDE